MAQIRHTVQIIRRLQPRRDKKSKLNKSLEQFATSSLISSFPVSGPTVFRCFTHTLDVKKRFINNLKFAAQG